MFRCCFRSIFLVLAVTIALSAPAKAQIFTGGDGLVDKFNALLPFDHSRPLTVPELCHRIDCLAEEMRDDGLVIVKQPDVFSQARLTRFRFDVDAQMSSDLTNFHLVLAARINRLDAATTTSTTALGAALSAPGTTNVSTPDPTKGLLLSASPNPNASGTTSSLFGPGTSLFPNNAVPTSAFGSLAPPASNTPAAGVTPPLTLGVEPTVYLEEKKRFLDQLNQIRRLNLGPDQNDASGYGLYVVRMPVSITPGECTFQGHGADLAVHVEHEFTPDFLPSTFQHLVINDLVDRLGPFIYEAIRSGFYDTDLKPRHEARVKRAGLKKALPGLINNQLTTNSSVNRLDAQALTKYILRTGLPLTGDPDQDQPSRTAIVDRLNVLAHSPSQIPLPQYASEFQALKPRISEFAHGRISADTLLDDVTPLVCDVVAGIKAASKTMASADLVANFYGSALVDDVGNLDTFLGLTDTQKAPLSQITQPLANYNAVINQSLTKSMMKLNVNLASVRTPKQFYPIAPREILDFFLEENIYLLATDAYEASQVKVIRVSEVRDYLRHVLDPAYFAMTRPTEKVFGWLPPLVSDEFMSTLHEALRERLFGGKNSDLDHLYKDLVDHLKQSRDNIENKPIAALCWAIAVDAALLDAVLREDARKVFATNGVPCDPLDNVHLYYPRNFPNEAGQAAFREYVRLRWPIITFAIEPVTDQQNIADSFNLKRDLQLALSFAFATGQISFSQLDTFRRQIEQSSDAIALNRTITGFTQSNDMFGFRFTPRFQNPPNQRTNIGVIASQLISGGPGPDYQTRKSKLEPGIRELNAVLLIPTFLPVMRMDVTSNWFKLNDPEHLVFHTSKMMERGRRVQELRQAVVDTFNTD
jgi:hypothetical protein